jgi:hypothetical protein
MSLKAAAENALAAGIENLDADRRSATLRAVVVPTVHDAELEAACKDIRRGDGGELEEVEREDGRLRRPKLHSAYSSCGLALNTFGPWRLDPTSLVVSGETSFQTLQFEQQLRIFRGGRAPNLDVVITAPAKAIAIESKLTEHLGKKTLPTFSGAYDRLRPTTHRTWWQMYERLRRDPGTFSYLDAGQLVKHYFGLKAFCEQNGGQPTVLLYLYWEPFEADSHPELRQHREEVERFRQAVHDPSTTFCAMSHAELWNEWERLSEPSWLVAHVAELRRRYARALPLRPFGGPESRRLLRVRTAAPDPAPLRVRS